VANTVPGGSAIGVGRRRGEATVTATLVGVLYTLVPVGRWLQLDPEAG
jgi:hypothetical protein